MPIPRPMALHPRHTPTLSASPSFRRYKEQASEEITAGYGRELLATIIGYGLPRTRRGLIETLEHEAQEACERARVGKRRLPRARPFPQHPRKG